MSTSHSSGPKNFVVMGAGQVGFHLAQSLSRGEHDVTVIDISPEKLERVEEELDARVVVGNGAHPPVLTNARVATSDLFMAVSSSDEANLTAAIIAKHLGAARTVVRVAVADEVIADRRIYEDLFGVDLLLSTQLLTTTRILNRIRGHHTVAVEYLAAGKVQLRKVQLDSESPLTRHPLREVSLPKDSLVVAFFQGDKLVVPGGDDRARPGDEALILGTTEAIGPCERMISSGREVLGDVVVAGGGETAQTVTKVLLRLGARVRIIESDGRRAKELAERFPSSQVIHGDATDLQLLKSERIASARTFVALTGEDDSNLMACLLAQELEVEQVLALAQRAETSKLWQRLDLHDVFSPRSLAYERISEYIDNDYSATLVSLQRGAARVLERMLEPASPAAGVTLAEMGAPRGLIVGAVRRGEKVFVPGGSDRLEAGDLVILFVQEEELQTVNLLFPAREPRLGAGA
ncbi:MAG: Trk system potassium transporter TrkA [Acidobacteriota bacterium]|nr:Trk system potassium transporter TrkA [Acidobacteriota bacterium]